MTRVRIKPRSYDQSRCKNDVFALSAALPIKSGKSDFWEIR